MSQAYHTVHVRVNDAATGQPTPVRVRFVGPNSQYLAPLGRLTEFATGENEDVGGNLQLGPKLYAYTDGSFEISLPAGPITVEISKGPEYWPVTAHVDLPPGKMALRFSIARWSDLRAKGWHSGDTRLHFLSPHGALLEAAAEDVAVANLLAAETFIASGEAQERSRCFPAIPNLLAFSGQQPAVTAPGHMVVVNTFNQHPALGSLALLNCHRVVHPLGFGDWRGDNWTLAAWCDQCHRKGGLVVWADVADHPAAAFGEALADVMHGKIDAIEVTPPTFGATLSLWYTLLNCGFRVPLVGASGKRSNREPVGSVRTYAQLLPDQELSYQSWIWAIRAGRTFVTTGPLLSLTVNEEPVGSSLPHLTEKANVLVRAEARGITPFHHLEIVANGEAVATTDPVVEPGSSLTTAMLQVHVPLPAGGWVAARCVGEDPANVIAHTSPVYVERERPASGPHPDVLASESRLQANLLKALAWVADCANCQSDRERENLTSILHSAKNILQHRAAGL